MVNADYIVKALGNFKKIFKKKKPITAQPVARAPTLFAGSRPANFFLFLKMKKELVGLTLTRETFSGSELRRGVPAVVSLL
jgi:hypothetical protein